MNTLVLTSESANLSIAHLLKQVDSGGVEVQDSEGRVVAFVLSPTDRQAWTYAEAALDLSQHPDEISRALQRTDGVTTSELLQNAASAVKKEPSP
jgi:hypothetical protein